MVEMEQHTVDSLKNLLEELSRHGHGDMPIFVGISAPLLKDAVNINYLDNKFTLRSWNYDRDLVKAVYNLNSKIEKAVREYFDETYNAGRNIKLDYEKVSKYFKLNKEENNE